MDIAPGDRDMLHGRGDMETVTEQLLRTWQRTDRIFGLLAEGAILAQPIALRHPFLFYVGHLPAFAWSHVCGRVLGRPAFHARFDDVFSRGIDPDVDDPTRCHDHPEVPDRWPALAAVLGYRDQVREAVLQAVDAVAERAAADPTARADRVFAMVIEHELMHQETLLYMMQRLPAEQKVRPAWLPDLVLGAGTRTGPVAIPAGRAVLGAADEDLPFGWDNEFPTVELTVAAFRIDATAVTNAEFLEFVTAGGYARPALWREEDRAWVRQEDLAHPRSWERREGQWRYRTLFDDLPLERVADWPACVSQAEARAYARWRGGRLPTEAEYHRAAFGEPRGTERRFPWGDAAPTEAHGNFDFARWAPTPVGTHPAGASAWGVHDLVGDGWEWTGTPFAGFPGFQALACYPGYSADFFDGKHYVLKGASWATAGELVRRSFRNWFQARYPYVFAKFRCVSAA